MILRRAGADRSNRSALSFVNLANWPLPLTSSLAALLVGAAADYRTLRLGYAVLTSAYHGKLVQSQSNLLTGKSTKPITPLYVK